MRKNLDLDHSVNKQQAVLAAYVEEFEENDRKIAEGAWATALDLSRITHWYPILTKYCPNHPHTHNLKWEREYMKKREDLAAFFFFDCWD
jgi:hypothetical protein